MTDNALLGILEVGMLAFFLGVTFRPSFAEAVGRVLMAHAAAWRAAVREYSMVFRVEHGQKHLGPVGVCVTGNKTVSYLGNGGFGEPKREGTTEGSGASA